MMDDLYDNLENYHDGNIIDELKNENKDLKMKLEEYSSAMIRLQQDFDKLNLEYKKLEMNYSSLLKTARAEIERKSEMIKSLNTEKDMLIIKTLQSSGRNILNTRCNSRWSNRSPEVDAVSRTKTQPAPQVNKENEGTGCKNDRSILHCNQSESSVSRQENKCYFGEQKEVRDTHNPSRNNIEKPQDNKITEEIYKDVPMQRHITTGAKITNRRKSMPMSRLEPIFSEDDDFETLNVKNTRKSPLKEDTRHYENYGNSDKCYRANKDKFSNIKTNRFKEQDKYRHDRYESSSKNTRHNPEKYHSKYTRDNLETHKQRSDYKSTRQRVLRSPPPDKYNRSKSRDRRPIEREYHFDKQERHSPHANDYSARKHKIRNEIEEPSNKRQKTEILDSKASRKNMVEETKVYYNEPEPEHVLRSNFTKQHNCKEPTSCQSPDYVFDSATPQHVTKEIKHTAVTSLEDPRVASRKYLIKTHKDKTFLSTVACENVDIKPIDVHMWDIPNKYTFMISPTRGTERLPKEIDNKIIDNPSLNSSLEPGEIPSPNPDKHTNDSNVDEMCEDVKIDKSTNQSKKLNSMSSTNKKTSPSNKYKIPKIKTCDEQSTDVKHELLSKKLNLPIISEGQNQEHGEVSISSQTISNLIENDKDDENKHNKIVKPKTMPPEIPLPLVPVGTLADDLELSDETSESLQKEVKKSKKVLNKRRTSVIINKEEKSLPLLSGESTHSEFKEKNPPKSKKVPKDSSRVNDKTRKSRKKIGQQESSCTEENEDNKESTCTNVKEHNNEPIYIKENEGSKESSCTKVKERNYEPSCTKAKAENKECTKSKEENSTKVKERNNEPSCTKAKAENKECTKSKEENKVPFCTKSMQQKKELKLEQNLKLKPSKPVISIQTKHKFSDLFGDSSSLITPDDLGITAPVIQFPLTDKYVSIFDNTQDAVDLSVEDINKVTTQINEAEDELSHDKKNTQKAGTTVLSQDIDKNTSKSVLSVNNSIENDTKNNEPEVVKTVIISTGVQPYHHITENITLQNNQQTSIDHKAKIDNDKANFTCLKALATSTPHKVEYVGATTSEKVQDSNATNRDNEVSSLVSDKSNLSSNISNGANPDEKKDEDVPDVRIFVKRRRKIIKKP